jgi:hypothetical protein
VHEFGKQHCYCVKLQKKIGSLVVFLGGLNYASLAPDKLAKFSLGLTTKF